MSADDTPLLLTTAEVADLCGLDDVRKLRKWKIERPHAGTRGGHILWTPEAVETAKAFARKLGYIE